MPSVQYYAAATLDGFIADPDDGLGWLFGYDGSYDGPDAEPGPMSEDGSYERFYEGVGALVSGSTTYEFVIDHIGEAGEWPYPDKPYWVLTSRELALPGDERADVRIVGGEVGELRQRLLESAGDRNLWVVGGGNVASQFADAGMLDELLVTVVPVILGTGKPLFDRPPESAFRLTGTRAHDNGMVELRYAR